MKQEIILQHDYQETFRTKKIAGLFDLSPEKKLQKIINVDLPIENKKWRIGLIIGSSGSGKTTIAKNLFPNEYKNQYNISWGDKSILEYFPENLEINKIINILSHIGFSSPPAWLLSYHCLSSGQQFRVNVARQLFNDNNLILVDEFTSVVDRVVAKIGCAAISKYIKKTEKQFIGVSCHYDICDWIEPDWIFDVDKNEFNLVYLRRPKIECAIYECSKNAKQQIWNIFKNHHYLSADLSKRAKVFYMLIDNIFCGFTSYITMPLNKNEVMFREYRTVILPDFQGVGLGNKLSEFLGEYIYNNFKKTLFSTTSHPAMIFYRNKNKNWQMISSPKIKKGHSMKCLRSCGSHNRLTASFKYIGGYIK